MNEAIIIKLLREISDKLTKLVESNSNCETSLSDISNQIIDMDEGIASLLIATAKSLKNKEEIKLPSESEE